MFENGLRCLISSTSISSVSVVKWHFFNDVKFCSAGFALIAIRFGNRVRRT